VRSADINIVDSDIAMKDICKLQAEWLSDNEA